MQSLSNVYLKIFLWICKRDIYIKEIEEASTIWLSSSLKGLLPVKKIVNKNYIPSAQDKMLKITQDIFNNKYYNF